MRAQAPWLAAIATVLVVLLVVELAHPHEEELVELPDDGLYLHYAPVPADEILLRPYFAGLEAVTVSARVDEASAIVEVGNWTLDAGSTLAWAFGDRRGVVQFLALDGARVLDQRYVFVGDATILIADSPADLLRRFTEAPS